MGLTGFDGGNSELARARKAQESAPDDPVQHTIGTAFDGGRSTGRGAAPAVADNTDYQHPAKRGSWSEQSPRHSRKETDVTPEQLARLTAEAEARGDFAGARRWLQLLRLACIEKHLEQRSIVDTTIEQRHWTSTVPIEYWLVADGEPLPVGVIIALEQIVPGWTLVQKPINPNSEKGHLHA